MRRYETIFIVRADLPADDIHALIDRCKSIVTSFKGKVVKVQLWGKRRLAYSIEKKREGFYVLIDFVSDHHAVHEMERNFRIDDSVLRYQSVMTSDSVNMEEIEREIAKAQRDETKPAEDARPEAHSASEVQADAGEKAVAAETGDESHEITGDDEQ